MVEHYRRPSVVEAQLTELLGHPPEPLSSTLQGDYGKCPCCFKMGNLFRQESDDTENT
jgi:hypothetical protein